MAALRARFKLWIELDGKPLLGEGGYALLRAIDEAGSIMGACKRLNLSYRKAMSYLRKMERRLGKKVLRTRKGGRGGGGAELTEDCRALLDAYEAIRSALEEVLEKVAPAVLSGLWAEGA
ncbi:hypothetical protein DRO33_03885 [Candidatus Bathyarchaeota archaeon]|nr:MAG: hypothetical protein DRO33_03885 [Candidatus Bathyarchaeota archaeon]